MPLGVKGERREARAELLCVYYVATVVGTSGHRPRWMTAPGPDGIAGFAIVYAHVPRIMLPKTTDASDVGVQ